MTENILTFSRPFARYEHIKIGSRATAIKYGNRQIAMFSPPRFTDNVMSALKHHFGSTDVRFIMTLNSNHLDDLWAWGRMFPFAKIIASEDAILTRNKKEEYLELDSQHWVTISSENKNSFKTGDAAFDAEFESMWSWTPNTG